ncbi:hypothetical protein H7F36_16420 [Variovorax sp. PAMC28562]|uniref:hypothetical protein n=1 Tax=Variovorax sp. PAMC28562 TaxID=2762323 RepID=UPI00164DB7BA|nr:hypothetical protein [Variovorax sp. PAMC28562]QNK72757.1 hypothetical protein H7F36_16420 [Variovorax sp. PAMC28562]
MTVESTMVPRASAGLARELEICIVDEFPSSTVQENLPAQRRACGGVVVAGKCKPSYVKSADSRLANLLSREAAIDLNET